MFTVGVIFGIVASVLFTKTVTALVAEAKALFGPKAPPSPK